MKTIEEELIEVERLIIENKELQKKYPEHKNGLEISLQSLLELKKEMERALK